MQSYCQIIHKPYHIPPENTQQPAMTYQSVLILLHHSKKQSFWHQSSCPVYKKHCAKRRSRSSPRFLPKSSKLEGFLDS